LDVYISSAAHLRLWNFIDSVSTEIGGMGYANLLEDGDVLVKEVFLLPQIVSAAEVDFDETGGDAFAIEKACNDGVLTDPSFVWFSWHSHNSMGVGWSPTDDKRIEALRLAGIHHLVSFVGNHRHEYKCRYDAYGIEHHGARIPHVEMHGLELYLDPAEDWFAACEAEIKEHVKKKVHTVQTWKGGQLVGSRPAGTPTQPGRTLVRELSESEMADSAFEVGPTGPDSQGVIERDCSAQSEQDEIDGELAGWGLAGLGGYDDTW
jgi:hypothetical protein